MTDPLGELLEQLIKRMDVFETFMATQMQATRTTMAVSNTQTDLIRANQETFTQFMNAQMQATLEQREWIVGLMETQKRREADIAEMKTNIALIVEALKPGARH